MEKTIHSLMTLFLCFTFISVTAQTIDIEEYHQENGLPTDLIKALAFDKDGYLWVAADGGIIKMIGNECIPIKNIERTSKYYKNLLFTKSYGLITASDDGLISINYKGNNFTSEFSKNTFKFDSWPELLYPKSLFEASDSTLWVGTNNGIAHLTKTNLTFLLLPENCNTFHYVRNHQFFEIKNQIYVICQKGYLFRVDNKTKQLINIPWPYDGFEAFSALAFDKNRALIGNTQGLIEVHFPEKGETPQFINLNFPYPVSVIRLFKDKYYLGTWSQGAFKATISQGLITYEPINKTEHQTINDLQFDSEDQLWVGTNFGVKLIRNLIFKRQFIDYTDNYIQDIAKHSKERIYFTDGWRVAVINTQSMESKPFFRINDDLILRLLPKENEVWMTTKSGKIIIQKNDGSNQIIDFSSKGKDITAIAEDAKGNTWILQNRNKTSLVRIAPDLTTKEYVDSKNSESNFCTIEIDPKGELYVGGHGKKSYLYKFDFISDSLVNISKQLTGLNKNRFEINDIAFSDSGRIMLGASEGLWEQKENAVERIDLAEMNIENVAALCFDKQERIWFVNSSGLLLWDGKQVTIFNNYDGLPSKTITPRNLVIDNQSNIWIGTNLGMASGLINSNNSETPKPIIKSIESGFNQYGSDKTGRFLINSTIKVNFSVPLYPVKHLAYMYCLGNGVVEKWEELKTNNEYLVFENLKPGKYTFKLKAKGKGYYNWSDSATYEFEVYKKWYTHFWTIGIFYFLILVLIGIYLRFLKQRNEWEKKKLEVIIEQRTKALLDQNEELKVLNNNLNKAKESAEEAIKSKDRFFSILAHDLKSPFNTLIGFSELLANNRDQIPEESMQEIFEDMLKTSENTYKLLQNLLDWARSQTGALVVENRMIDVSLLLQEVLDTILPAAKQKNIKIIISQEDNLWIYADVSLMATSIRNILSNAIKFSFPESIIELSAQRENDDWVLIKIKDKGVGIPKDKIPFLFSIENNTSSIGTASEKGTGLGLILCKEFIERCNGTIFVESIVNKGSLFTLKIPAKN